MDWTQLNDIIKSSKNILIISHINPDGDTLGSMCGLYSAIVDNFRKKSDMLLMSKCPEKYSFLPYISNAKHVTEYDKSREYDLVINVDVASADRMFESAILFNKAKYTINIDHHVTNEKYGDFNYVLSEASSAGEVLYLMMKKMDWKISAKTAECLYTAILTDTGSFRYNNTTANSFEIAGALLKLGISPADIAKHCYESNSKEHVLFQANCLNNAIFSNNNKIAYIQVYKKDMERFNVAEDCTEGLTEQLRSISSVKVSFIVKQLSGNSSKISMRSNDIDIATVCAKFGGGGHKFAAGCLIKASVQEAAKKILEEVEKLGL